MAKQLLDYGSIENSRWFRTVILVGTFTGALSGTLYGVKQVLGSQFVTADEFKEHVTEDQKFRDKIVRMIWVSGAPARSVCYRLNGTPAECEPKE